MRRFIAILGTLLIAAVFIISGSAVAGYVNEYIPEGSSAVTNPDEAEGPEDYTYATVGINSPPTLGVLLLDLGDEENWMDAEQDFTVYGWEYGPGTNIFEEYTVVIYNDGLTARYGPYYGDDDEDKVFQTPSTPTNPDWRYIEINGTSGEVDFENHDDTIYGPEIDAVGWRA
ncbi:MAG: hypothetical protein JSW00_12170 [Thermoplasmata archaeon]|nr:MAG: hypothetical protein JSW00_12170 [Thermoplasmata archaeon]